MSQRINQLKKVKRCRNRILLGIAAGLISSTAIAQDCTNVAADVAFDFSPEDGSTTTLISSSLSWTEGDCTTSSHLYFGTNPTPSEDEFQGQQTSPWTPPEELEFETTYFWQIVTFNDEGPDTTGPVLSFTTRLTGACCANIAGDDFCFQAIEEACVVIGEYHGDFSTCDTIDCPTPTGSCCVGTTCFDEILEDQCLTFPGGLYYGDNTTCSEGVCDSPPTGACCVGESCSEETEVDCDSVSGTFQGVGTDCTVNPCVDPTGACCTEEICEVATVIDCLSSGGTYLGDNVSCDDSPCLVGACCVTEVCVEVTQEKCAVFNGLYQNDGTSCDDDPCALLDPSGACCVEQECTTETENSCLGIGGEFQGENSTCSDNTCDPTGACCVEDICEIDQEEPCQDAGGTYQGDATDCEEHTCDQLGACCIEEICIVMYELECDEFEESEYLGDGTSCSSSPCVTRLTGACCVGETCSILSQSDCLSAFGTYQGDDTTCDDDPCAIPRGACCALEMCIPDSPLEACDALAGTYLGDDSTCAGEPCASPVTVGACCIGSTCATVTESTCASDGGTYQGDDSLCLTAPCEPPASTGSCCVGETCSIKTEDDCLSADGEYQGNNTSCSTDQCAIGACCANEHCYENLKRADCLAIGGECEGIGTTCEDEPCTPAPTGSCCVNDGYLCMEIPEPACEELSGVYGGDSSRCGESTCSPETSGACCIEGECFWFTESNCVSDGGVFAGDNTTCLDVSCQSTPTPTGSCCTLGTCSIQTSAVCVGLGGTYFGDNTQCISTTCEDGTGACCVEEVCARSLQNDCETAGGTYHIGATCEEITCATLACCIETTCIEMSQTFCDAFGGIAFGDGTDCVTEECAEQPEAIVGACCVLGSECIAEITSDACAQTGGLYLGDNTSCSGTSCEDEQTHPQRPIVPEEACVSETITLEAPDQSYFEYDWQSRDPGDLTWDNLPGGQFTVQVTVHEEGLWVFQYRQRAQGDSWSDWVVLAGQTMVTDCDPTGACCVDGECSETTAALCEGAFLGDWTVCGSNSCDPSDGSATGACCVDDSCSVVSIGDCVGNYFGDGSDCSTISCDEVVGSCCVGDTCFRETIETCQNEGGIYRGDYSLCWENPCDAATLGACCLGSECHETTEEGCVGQWLGSNTVCEDETCDDSDTIIGPFQWTIEEGGNDHWYAIVVSGAICWDEANAEALADGAYLLTVTTASELAWWLSTFAGTGQEPLIGLHQLAGSAEPSQGWEWSNGEGDTLQNWAPGTPDDATGESNVAQMFSSGYWDDVLGCGATSYAIEYGQWFNVCETCEYQTIQAAVNDASSTETIYVDAGTYTSVDGTSLVDLQGKNISIIGKEASQTILDGQHAVSGLRYAMGTGETSTIQGVTIKDCVGTDGAAISVSGGELLLFNTALLGNVASESEASGGAILASGGVSLVLQGAEFSRNSSVAFGGAILLTDSGTTAQITDCLFSENESFYGGAMYISDGTSCTVDLVEFTNNTAAVDGGAVCITGDGSSFTSCCFRGNVAGNVGGAIDNRAGADTLLSESIFANNTAVYEGGALYNNSSSPYVYTCTFASNSSSEENGGGIHNDNDSMPSIEATLFCGNTGRGGSESTLEGHIYPTVADFDYEFVGGNEFHVLCSTCQGDVNGDGIVDLSDLLAIAMLSVWGECNDCLADLDNNGVVDPDDIVILIELLTTRLDHPCDVECPYRF